MSPPNTKADAGTGAAAVPAPSPWRPLIIRTVIGAIALLGLSGIGAGSMLLGLDGAHASPPAASNVYTPAAGASAGSAQSSSPNGLSSATSPPASTAVGASEQAAPCPARTEDGRVILNLAAVEDLRRIPGIGPKRAEAIILLRTKLRRFKRGADLLRVRGIGPKSLARMQAHFVVDPPIGSSCQVPSAAPSKY